MVEPGPPTKLVMMIVSDADADGLMDALIEQGIPATKVASSGGFLHRGNVTVFSGVAQTRVDQVIEIVNATCQVRQEWVPALGVTLSATLTRMLTTEGFTCWYSCWRSCVSASTAV